MRYQRLVPAIILVACWLPSMAQEEAQIQVQVQKAEPKVVPEMKVQQTRSEADQAPANVQVVEDRQNRLKAAIATFDELIRRKPPTGLTPGQLAEWNEQTRWLESVRDRYQKMNSAYLPARQRSPATDMATLNAEFLTLQNAVQMESRKFQTLSNASKARHDIAMAAIRNTRA